MGCILYPMASFQTKLGVELEARNMGYRTLARLIDPDNVESARRAIRKWMKGVHTPTRASRDAVTDALGLERGALDPDDEEESLMRALMAGLQTEPIAVDALRRMLEKVA